MNDTSKKLSVDTPEVLADEYVVKSNSLETKPFGSYEEAKNFALAWKGHLSIFWELDIYKNGDFVESVYS